MVELLTLFLVFFCFFFDILLSLLLLLLLLFRFYAFAWMGATVFCQNNCLYSWMPSPAPPPLSSSSLPPPFSPTTQL
uniref:Uncharacterized protein n=1 Tax=Octopus bimaculoides TaxID=37653 RepID=A0A0L8HHR9_OCTBM